MKQQLKTLEKDCLLTERLKLNVVKGVDSFELIFSGFIDERNSDYVIFPFFNKIHRMIIESGIKTVNLNFKNLNFVDSCGIKCFVQWIVMAVQLPEISIYNFNFIVNSKIPWQELSVSNFQYLAPGHVKIIAN